MNRLQFLSIIEKEKLKQDKETYYQIKDNLELYLDYKCLGISCYSCSKSDHVISNCPFIHYVIKPDEILRKNFRKETLFRKIFKRKRTNKTFNCRSNLTLIQSSSFAVMNAFLMYQEEGVDDFRIKRIDIKIEDYLDENTREVGISSYNFQKFKDEQDFDKILNFKNEDFSDMRNLPNMFKINSSESHIICNISPKNKKLIQLMEPKTNKSLFCKNQSQNFNESCVIATEESIISCSPEENETNFTKKQIEIEEYVESFSIDKIGHFTKYFPKNNFEEFKRKHNHSIENYLKMKSSQKQKQKSIKNQEVFAKIDLMKKKTIRNKKEFFNLTSNLFEDIVDDSEVIECSNMEKFDILSQFDEKKNRLNFRRDNYRNTFKKSLSD